MCSSRSGSIRILAKNLTRTGNQFGSKNRPGLDWSKSEPDPDPDLVKIIIKDLPEAQLMKCTQLYEMTREPIRSAKLEIRTDPLGRVRLCDNKGARVSVIKVKGTGQLIGGCNSQSWHSRNAWLEGKGSFIFSLGDSKVGNAKLRKFASGCGPYDESFILINKF
ncbi:hypothetical protein G9A89_004063 [Geosiphon pyriformis]|nr:hypothetical protein G9A89_004063 [Geosiphon pyriformis]